MGKLLIGTSGFNYKDWRLSFYPKGLPQKECLSYYAQRYNTVEVNATFYRHFPREVFAHGATARPMTSAGARSGTRRCYAI